MEKGTSIIPDFAYTNHRMNSPNNVFFFFFHFRPMPLEKTENKTRILVLGNTRTIIILKITQILDILCFPPQPCDQMIIRSLTDITRVLSNQSASKYQRIAKNSLLGLWRITSTNQSIRWGTLKRAYADSTGGEIFADLWWAASLFNYFRYSAHNYLPVNQKLVMK